MIDTQQTILFVHLAQSSSVTINLQNKIKELKEINEEFIDWKIINDEHVFEFRSCFWLNFAKLFKYTAAEFQIDQLNKHLHDKYPNTTTRIINVEDFLKWHELLAGAIEET